MSHVIHTGSNLDILPTLPDNSIDAIVTDPPYELGFMGKSWDSTGIAYNVALWKECLRVLKPGGHLLAFSGSRTYHRMTCAIEDAGFEIRDQMLWVYGSGFPKSHNISKAMDKDAGAQRKIVGSKIGLPGYHLKGHQGGEAFGNGISSSTYESRLKSSQITAPSSDEAKQWEGWGTALKPAHEPICLARKPIEGTVADNVLKWGVGGLNIDGCRVGDEPSKTFPKVRNAKIFNEGSGGQSVSPPTQGRFPANLMHDGSQEVLEFFPQTHGAGTFRSGSNSGNIFPKRKDEGKDKQRKALDDGGSAARFFYCPKASKSDRESGNNHPTVKPTELMRYLCRLITPPGGTVLDPFNGSGSTGKAAVLEGFNYVGIEMNPEYVTISEARIKGATER